MTACREIRYEYHATEGYPTFVLIRVANYTVITDEQTSEARQTSAKYNIGLQNFVQL